jgi:DnaK suppressor protein
MARNNAGKAPSGKAHVSDEPDDISGDESGHKYAPDALGEIRKVLVEQRQIILKEAKSEITNFVKGDDRQLVEAALDDGDWSVIDLSESLILQKLQQHKIKLHKIDESIRKIADGTYGACEECGQKISPARLKVLPYAVYCVECKERLEKIEKAERESPFQ